MWPADPGQPRQQQPGGHPAPPQPQPPRQQQPGYGPGYPQPGHPYGAYGYGQGVPPPYGQQPAQGWSASPPAPPQPPGRRRGLVIGIAVAAAVVLVGAAAGAVALTVGHAGKTVASPAGHRSPSASTAPPVEGGVVQPRGNDSVAAVVPGWQADVRGDNKVAFDVPPGWVLPGEQEIVGYHDKDGGSAVVMGGPALYRTSWCGDNWLAVAGTQGAQGAKSLSDAAQSEAAAWAYYGFNDLKSGKTGTLTRARAVPFSNSHGIHGYVASATETNVPRTSKCATDGETYAIAWTGADNLPTVWVFSGATGVPGQVPESVIRTMEESIRQVS